MELKNSEDVKEENKKTNTTGLKLAGVDNEEMLRKAKESQTEVWDFSQDMEPVKITSAKSALKREVEEAREVQGSDVILRVSGALVYIMVVVEVLLLIWISTQGAISFMTNMNNFSFVFTLCSAVLLVDAIIVNLCFERKWSLIFIAWLLPFLYPAVRRSFVKNEAGFAVIVSVLYFLSICCFGMMVGSEYMRYGGILLVEDAECRTVAIQLLDHPWEDGQTLGDVFMEHMLIEDARIVVSGKQKEIVIEGKGLLYPFENTFARGLNKNIPTSITFVQEESGTGYSIKRLILNEEEMSEKGIILYWETLMK